jgi:hypothetical protein
MGYRGKQFHMKMLVCRIVFVVYREGYALALKRNTLFSHVITG